MRLLYKVLVTTGAYNRSTVPSYFGSISMNFFLDNANIDCFGSTDIKGILCPVKSIIGFEALAAPEANKEAQKMRRLINFCLFMRSKEQFSCLKEPISELVIRTSRH